MKALLLDPEWQRFGHLEFDGSEESIANILGCKKPQSETYVTAFSSRIRVYSNPDSESTSSLPGYILEHTGGAVNHGRALVVGVADRQHLTDVPRVNISYFYIPGKGAFGVGHTTDD